MDRQFNTENGSWTAIAKIQPGSLTELILSNSRRDTSKIESMECFKDLAIPRNATSQPQVMSLNLSSINIFTYILQIPIGSRPLLEGAEGASNKDSSQSQNSNNEVR